ncbi:MAG: DUF790 family protein [Candidatus Lokiarchaeota archaeon]|nr:DUF790 family protein [Candidatus Lokiarchaeota archaeon]MBD3340774.1 DUF790 family protein [Candidatus Lokiarchaeota archaeon]
MLAKDLLNVKFSRGTIQPHYLKSLELPNKVISIYNKALGKKYREIKESLRNLEKGRTDYKTIRGLSELVRRRSVSEPCTELDSVEVRTALFEKGFVLDEDKRKEIIESTARDFERSPAEIENAIFADLEKEQVLKKLKLHSAEELLRNFNLSITQTLLFNCLEMTLQIEGNYQALFRMINFLGLMYETDGKEIKITGPASLLKKTRKYGVKFAQLLPYIVSSERWSINAKIEMVRGGQPRVFDFNLTSDVNLLFPLCEIHVKEFDSDVEEQFYKDFKLFAPEWRIEREPKFIKAGNYVIIPDFGFFKNNLTIYMEIIGFWTPEYIKKKIQKFNLTKTRIIAAINKNLRCSRSDFPGEVIFYDKRIPIKKVLKILNKETAKLIKREIRETKEIKLDEDIVSIKDKSNELNITPETLENLKPEGYVVVGDKLLSERFLLNLKETIGEHRKFSIVKKILNKYDLTDKALNLIGFEVVWKGLNPVRIVSRKPHKK